MEKKMKKKEKERENKRKKKEKKRKTVDVKTIFTFFPLDINGYERGNAFRVNIVVQGCFS